MASIDKRAGSYRARVLVKGVPDAATFPTRKEAAAWALQREAELSGKRLPTHTLAAALRRYARDVSPTKAGERWEQIRLEKIEREWSLASRPIGSIVPADIAEWRDGRLALVAGASVAREMNLLKSVFRLALREWGWISTNPMDGIQRPPGHNVRSRRVSDDEARALCFALGWDQVVMPANASQRVAVMVLFAIETAMRSGEMVSLTWDQVHIPERFAHLIKSKNGDQRDVPLSRRAVELLQLLPRESASVFGVDSATRDALFRKARDRAGIVGLTFHDTRHEATTRLARKLDVLDLSRVTGHRDLRSLRGYYNPTASELADRLDR